MAQLVFLVAFVAPVFLLGCTLAFLCLREEWKDPR